MSYDFAIEFVDYNTTFAPWAFEIHLKEKDFSFKKMTLYLKASDYDDFIHESGVKIIKFTASWCGPCKVVAPRYEALSSKYPKFLFVNLDIDESGNIADIYDISSVPTFIVLDGSEAIGEVKGTDLSKLDAILQNL